jgi:hypothetical protein
VMCGLAIRIGVPLHNAPVCFVRIYVCLLSGIRRDHLPEFCAEVGEWCLGIGAFV